jgi:sirohydrochlorin cobaltochelatase
LKNVTTALILAGHGSHISPRTAGIIWEQVDKLRTMGVADEVTAAFWKETPSFSRVLSTVRAEDIAVVPLFTAQGYFAQTVIPAEMGLDSPLTVRNGKIIRYTRTLSEHPYSDRIVRQRVEEGLQLSRAPQHEVAVAIIGHSTRRNPESRLATERQADLIRASGLAAEVVAVYLDDDPGIPEVYQLTTARTLIAVPYFLAAGSHTTLDVPERLGLDQDQSVGQTHGRTVFYMQPVGTDDTLLTAILELAREAGALLNTPKTGSPWDCFPAAGRNELVDAIAQSGEMRFGQLLLTPTEVRPLNDDNADPILLPETLRLRVREPEGKFRTLATSNDLPGSWHVPLKTPAQAHAVVETIYPGAVADWADAQRGQLAVKHLVTVIQRQTGMFRHLDTLDQVTQTEVVVEICGGCVRHPTWFDREVGHIPCAEPCNVWLCHALEHIQTVEGAPRG